MDKKKKYISHLQAKWGPIIVPEKSFSKNELYLQLHPKGIASLPAMCADIVKTFDAQFVTLVATDERSEKRKYVVSYVFSIARDDLFLILRLQVDPGQHEIPSVSSHLEAANWFEREMKDWFGIIPFPNIQKLAVHPDWPEDLYPMLKDFIPERAVPRVRGSFDFKHVEGEGVFEIPVGPVHAGIIEPGHFRFSVAGEPIINLDIQLYYTHKGTEKIAEGMNPQQAVFLAERISGDSSFAHALAFCHAIERACELEIPQRALIVRTILLELERLYNHIGDIGAILLDVGFAVGAATASTLKERFMHLNEILTGSRLLRGIAAVGGVRCDIENTSLKREALGQTIQQGRDAFEHLVALALSSSTVRDRLETTGILPHEVARRLGIVGIAARASGIPHDFRRDHPHCAYKHLEFRTALQTAGDVFARMNVRIDEVRESFHILDQICHQHTEDRIVAAPPRNVSDRYALGYVEGWRGEIVHWIMTDKSGNLTRWKITDPSSHNWRALKVSVLDNIIPDFPVINKSYNLSYSGNDR
jgi:Ni,Fe-hydrogenase III large subunit/Ni,Fe-hydrogenase III component G